MEKFIVMGTLIVCFAGYGALPWVTAVLQLMASTESSVEILSAGQDHEHFLNN